MDNLFFEAIKTIWVTSLIISALMWVEYFMRYKKHKKELIERIKKEHLSSSMSGVLACSFWIGITIIPFVNVYSINWLHKFTFKEV